MNNTSRRQFLRYSQSAIFGLFGFSLASVLFKQLESTTNAETVVAVLPDYIPSLMDRSRVPGLAIAIVKDGEILYDQGFGVKNTRTLAPVTENTVFAAASLSKPLFAYGVLKLVEQGKLDLDTPLTKYTKKPYISDPKLKLITARMVLSHTTGFPNWSGDAPPSIQRIPGSRFGYSGEGYLYLQKVVEEITNQSLDRYMRNQVFSPLEMNESSYVWRPDYQTLASNGHDRSGTPFPVPKTTKAISAGSLRTTAGDYAKFLRGMMTPGSVDSPLLTAETLKKMLTPQVNLSLLIDWGLGWGLERTYNGSFFWHLGDAGIYKSFALASNNLKTGLVILTNSENGLEDCRDIIKFTMGEKHPSLNFDAVGY